MSLQLLADAWRDTTVTGVARLTLLYLASNAHDDGTLVIAKNLGSVMLACNCSQDEASDAIIDLINLGYLRFAVETDTSYLRITLLERRP